MEPAFPDWQAVSTTNVDQMVRLSNRTPVVNSKAMPTMRHFVNERVAPRTTKPMAAASSTTATVRALRKVSALLGSGR